MTTKFTQYARNRDAAMRARGLDFVRVWVPEAAYERLKADASAAGETVGEIFTRLARKHLEEL